MIQFQSVALFAKGCHYSAGNKYNTLFSCMQTVDNTDNSVRQRYPAHVFRSRFTSKVGCHGNLAAGN